jgi:hypothetical protein
MVFRFHFLLIEVKKNYKFSDLEIVGRSETSEGTIKLMTKKDLREIIKLRMSWCNSKLNAIKDGDESFISEQATYYSDELSKIADSFAS